uniref:Ribonuclease III n=2 Tax=Opuntia streptacantha TaxID=393608 RepID=A0A7C8ZPE7_OPUST
MALASARVSPVRVSWDTQQRLRYNRNAPRKIKKPDSLSLSSVFPSTSETKQNSRFQIDVDGLLKINAANSRQVNLEESTYMGYERWLPSPPKVEKPRSSHNAAALAYIGDSIYELYARRHFFTPALNIEEYNDRVMAVVRCEAQDALLQKLLSEKFLMEEERDVLRWGKNINSAKTRTTKRAGVAVYNRASSLETLIGYLYLTNPKRLDDMMSKLGFSVGFSNQSILDDVNMELENMKEKRPRDKVPQLIRSKVMQAV